MTGLPTLAAIIRRVWTGTAGIQDNRVKEQKHRHARESGTPSVLHGLASASQCGRRPVDSRFRGNDGLLAWVTVRWSAIRNGTFPGLPFTRSPRAGIAAVEFAILAPILILLLVVAADGAQAIMAEMRLSAAVSAGADYALNNAINATSTNGAGMASTIAAIVGNANGTGWAGGTVVINNGPTATFTGGSSTPSGTAANADSYYCLTGTPGAWVWGTAYAGNSQACITSTAGKFVTIAASHSYTPMLSGFGFIPTTLYQYAAVQVK
jgi:Flp pilus assembly protein TadG